MPQFDHTMPYILAAYLVTFLGLGLLTIASLTARRLAYKRLALLERKEGQP